MAKETGVNVANLASVVLNMTEPEFAGVIRSRGTAKVLEDMKSIAGSALDQREPSEPGEPDPQKYMMMKRAFKEWAGELYFNERHEDHTPKLGKFEAEELYRCGCDLFGLDR